MLDIRQRSSLAELIFLPVVAAIWSFTELEGMLSWGLFVVASVALVALFGAWRSEYKALVIVLMVFASVALWTMSALGIGVPS